MSNDFEQDMDDDEPERDIDEWDAEGEGWVSSHEAAEDRLCAVIERALLEGRLDPVLEEAVRKGVSMPPDAADAPAERAGALFAQCFAGPFEGVLEPWRRGMACGERTAAAGIHYAWFAPLFAGVAHKHEAIAGFAQGYARTRLSPPAG